MKDQLIIFVKRNKFYVGIILFFLIYMLLFDEYNWLRIRRDKHKLESLKEERISLQNKIEQDKKELKSLKTDPNALERLAREEYFLKKDNEEIYVIIEDKK